MKDKSPHEMSLRRAFVVFWSLAEAAETVPMDNDHVTSNVVMMRKWKGLGMEVGAGLSEVRSHAKSGFGWSKVRANAEVLLWLEKRLIVEVMSVVEAAVVKPVVESTGVSLADAKGK
jgi:hypothetical protein